MAKTIRKYSSFAAVKDDEYREWQTLPAHARLDAAGELSSMQYRSEHPAGEVEPRVQRTLLRYQRALR
jgi:hypothetical protein